MKRRRNNQRRPQPRNGRPMRVSGCRCTQSRVDVGTPTQTPTHGYPEIDPRTHQFSRVRAPVDAKHGGALKKTWRRALTKMAAPYVCTNKDEKNMAARTNKDGGALCLH